MLSIFALQCHRPFYHGHVPLQSYDVIGDVVGTCMRVENGSSTCIHDSGACFFWSELETLMPPDLFPCEKL